MMEQKDLNDVMSHIMLRQYKEAGLKIPSTENKPEHKVGKPVKTSLVKSLKNLKNYMRSISGDFLTVATLSGSIACILIDSKSSEFIRFNDSITHYVCGSNVHVRSGASIEYPILDQVDTGVEIEVIDSQGNWAVVSWNNQRAYISYSYLKPAGKQACLREKMGVHIQ